MPQATTLTDRVTDIDKKWLQRSVELAKHAKAECNYPFGAVLVDPDGTDVLLEGENTVLTENDCTNHAELNLIRQASKIFEPEFLTQCTLYASTEPCPMCAGAIYLSGIGRLVYAVSSSTLKDIISSEAPNRDKPLNYRAIDILKNDGRTVSVLGPNENSNALSVHTGFWKTAP